MNPVYLQIISKTIRLYSPPRLNVPDVRVRRALRLSIWDGAFFCGMLALTDTFAVAAAVQLHAPSVAIGLLAGLPLFSGSIGQLIVARHFHVSMSRKKFVLIGTSGQSAFLCFVALAGFLPEQFRAWVYVLAFTLQGFFATIIGGLWMAWMSDLVEAPLRGRYFAFRNRIINTAQLFCGLAAGTLAFRHTVASSGWTFFLAIFATAGVLRFVSTLFLAAQYEPPVRIPPANEGASPGVPIKKPFFYFCITTALMQGAVMIASPFFNVWSVRDLHFSYFSLAVTTAATVLGSIIALPFWGYLSDRYGHYKILLYSGFCIALVPFPFLFTGNVVMIFIINFFTGIVWAGYNLSNFNHMLLLCEPEGSDRQISLANALTGISVFLFSLIGGCIAPLLPKIMTWQLQSLFLLSGVMRIGIYFLLFPGIPQNRRDKEAITLHLRNLIRHPRDSR